MHSRLTRAGNLVGLFFSPLLLATLGWRGLFYVFGALGLPLLAAWLAIVPKPPKLPGLEKAEAALADPIKKVAMSPVPEEVVIAQKPLSFGLTWRHAQRMTEMLSACAACLHGLCCAGPHVVTNLSICRCI